MHDEERNLWIFGACVLLVGIVAVVMRIWRRRREREVQWYTQGAVQLFCGACLPDMIELADEDSYCSGCGVAIDRPGQVIRIDRFDRKNRTVTLSDVPPKQ